jgi:hypothetical protein
MSGREWGAQHEHIEENDVVPAKENGDGEEACQRQTVDEAYGH